MEEWSTGAFQMLPFRQADYETVYEEILLDLKTLGEDNLKMFGESSGRI